MNFKIIWNWKNICLEKVIILICFPKVVSKWGEYSSEVQLILERSGGWGTSPPESPSPAQQKSASPAKRLQVKHQQYQSSQQVIHIHKILLNNNYIKEK